MWLSTIGGLVLLGALLFGSAGTLDYWQGWAEIAVMVVLSLPYTYYLLAKAPDVLERRMHAGPRAETRPAQKVAVGVLQLSFLAIIVVGGLDRRFGWSHMPTWLCVVGLAVTAIALWLTMWVVVQNVWAAATIRVEGGQELVTTGLYGVVRHPMYSGSLAMAAGMALGLGSYWALLLLVPLFGSLVARILDEESMLREDLPGYDAYTTQTRSRLIPAIW
ncbi:hypothetical protein MBRU_03640 [Mycolicibacterium brumae DSM 44177]|nr:hypothetical protein MBRU_03640 [Mycolicibacterium brumae DSM 44177]